MSRLLNGRLQQWRFTLYAPVYDTFVRLDGPRRRSIEGLALRDGERVLLVGAGTGADLAFLPPGVSVVATDVTPAMLERARAKAHRPVDFEIMDAHDLRFPDAAFDAVILHLILALVEDPVRCLQEATRVLRPGGRLAIFDKLLADGRRPGAVRRAANAVALVLATDINRRIDELLQRADVPLEIERDEPAALGGLFRIVRLRKRAGQEGLG